MPARWPTSIAGCSRCCHGSMRRSPLAAGPRSRSCSPTTAPGSGLAAATSSSGSRTCWRSARTGGALQFADNETLVNLIPDLFNQLYDAGWLLDSPTPSGSSGLDVYELHEVDDPDAVDSP